MYNDVAIKIVPQFIFQVAADGKALKDIFQPDICLKPK
jgi:hypothetical protein